MSAATVRTSIKIFMSADRSIQVERRAQYAIAEEDERDPSMYVTPPSALAIPGLEGRTFRRAHCRWSSDFGRCWEYVAIPVGSVPLTDLGFGAIKVPRELLEKLRAEARAALPGKG